MQMSEGMGGKHIFEATIASSDPAPAQNKLTESANFIEPGS